MAPPQYKVLNDRISSLIESVQHLAVPEPITAKNVGDLHKAARELEQLVKEGLDQAKLVRDPSNRCIAEPTHIQERWRLLRSRALTLLYDTVGPVLIEIGSDDPNPFEQLKADVEGEAELEEPAVDAVEVTSMQNSGEEEGENRQSDVAGEQQEPTAGLAVKPELMNPLAQSFKGSAGKKLKTAHSRIYRSSQYGSSKATSVSSSRSQRDETVTLAILESQLGSLRDFLGTVCDSGKMATPSQKRHLLAEMQDLKAEVNQAKCCWKNMSLLPQLMKIRVEVGSLEQTVDAIVFTEEAPQFEHPVHSPGSHSPERESSPQPSVKSNNTQITVADLLEANLSVAKNIEKLAEAVQNKNDSYQVMAQPKLKLSTFSDDVTEYLNWRELVEAAVLKSKMSKTQQHLFLVGHLDGKAKRLTQHVAPGETAIKAVMTILDTEFNSPRIVVRGVIEKMSNHEVVEAYNYEATSGFATVIEGVARTLRKHECCGDLQSIAVNEAAQARLSPSVQLEWIKEARKLTSEFFKKNPQTTRLEEMGKFLRQRAADLRDVVTQHEVFKPQQKQKKRDVGMAAVAADNNKCPLCKEKHRLENCKIFTDFPLDLRLKKIYELRVCRVCLNPFHGKQTNECRKQSSLCGVSGCKYVHHKMLHGAVTPKPFKGESRKKSVKEKQQHSGESGNVTQLAQATRTYICGVIKVMVEADGIQKAVSAFLDGGSTSTAIMMSLAKELDLPLSNTIKRVVHGYHATAEEEVSQVKFKVKGVHPEAQWHDMTALTRKKKFELPRTKVNWNRWIQTNPKFSAIPFEDTDYEDVQMLIGLDHLDLMFPEDGTRVTDKECGVDGWRTKLGWVIVGPLAGSTDVAYLCAESGPSVYQQLSSLMKDFMSVESLGTKHEQPHDHQKLLLKMEADTKVVNGRFQTPMLWKPDILIPESLTQAQRRLKWTKQKLLKDPRLLEMYQKGIDNDVQKGYVRKLTRDEVVSLFQSEKHYVLPHFGVFHPDKPHKIRRIMDAKARNSGTSLNDMLFTGPDLLTNLFSMLLNFRMGQYVINGDITEMFPQIMVTDEDTRMLAFLWEDTQGEMEVYLNLRHIFGATCSPSIANFCIKHVAKDQPDPVVKWLLLSAIYMDDFYGSFDNKEEGRLKSSVVKDELAKFGFVLGKLISNHPQMLEGFDEKEIDPVFKALKNPSNEVVKAKALGVIWNLKNDCFQLASRKLGEGFVNLSQFLSVLASVYDPLGFFGPYIMSGKLLMKESWICLRDWKKPIPPDLAEACEKWAAGLKKVSQLEIERWLGTTKDSQLWLWVCVDASKSAYCAAVHASFETDKRLSVTLIESKGRVAPAAKWTVPLLELLAFEMGANLALTVVKSLSLFSVSRIYFLSDSKVVLGQVRKAASGSKDVFCNHVGRIHQLLEQEEFSKRQVEIAYVRSARYPADLGTRPVSADDFCEVFQNWQSPKALLDAARQGKWDEELRTT